MSRHSKKMPALRVAIIASRFQMRPMKGIRISQKSFADHCNRGRNPITIGAIPIVGGRNPNLATSTNNVNSSIEI
jgi:hypothetical protein